MLGHTQGDPIAVKYELVASVLDQLGIHDHDDIIGVKIARFSITEERLRRDENGKAIRVGNQAVTTTNVIAIRRGES